MWDRTERRKMNPEYIEIKDRLHNIELSIGVMANKLENLHNSKNASHERIYETLTKHNEVIYGNGHEGLTNKITSLEGFKKDLKDHIISDRWAFGIIITLLLAILGKVLHG